MQEGHRLQISRRLLQSLRGLESSGIFVMHRLDEEEYGGHQLLLMEGLAPSIGVFLVRSSRRPWTPLLLRASVAFGCLSSELFCHALANRVRGDAHNLIRCLLKCAVLDWACRAAVWGDGVPGFIRFACT